MSEPVAQPKTIVLNVNDSEVMRIAISALLRRAGFEVLEAATGEEALALIDAHEPHLVVLDVHLPGANGFEICRRVRKNPCRGTMRILHTSAMSVSLEDKIESLESGADGFLQQPFELEALLSCVRSLLDIGQAADPLESVVTASSPAPDSVAPTPPAEHALRMLEQIGDGVLGLDTSWRFTFVNATAERLLGRKREELLGEVIWTALPTLEASTLGAAYRRAMKERVAVTMQGLRPGSNAVMRARALPTPEGLLVLIQDASVAQSASSRRPRAERGQKTLSIGKRTKTLRGL